MRLPPKINHIIELGGILIPLIVDLTLCSICFATQAPDMLTRFAFVAIGIMIVLFIFLSWSRRFYIPWFIFVIVTVFFDYSFTLESTRLQSQEITQTATEDSELTRIQGLIDGSNKTIDDLHVQYNNAMKRDTLDEINDQLKVENSKLKSYNADYKTRIAEMKEENKKAKISSNDIINAIPRAWKDKRYIALVIWALIFIGVQLIVVTSIDNSKQPVFVAEPEPPKKKKRTVKPLTQNDISRWVNWNWYRIESGSSANILPKEVFFDLVKKQNDTFNERIYTRIVASAKRNGVINNTGKVIILDKNKAKEMIK